MEDLRLQRDPLYPVVSRVYDAAPVTYAES
jgi:hypothetical protein